jgi:signal transduction histidine kinase
VRKLSGWTVGYHARSLGEATSRLEGASWDAVVLDLNLGDSRGVETVESLAPRSLPVPVVVLSSLQDEATAEGVLRAGAEDYLYKSEVDPWSLARSLQHARARFEMRQTLQRRNRDLELVTAAAAHDMRGPLRHIRSFLQLHERCASDKACPCLERVERASRRLNDVLDGLGDYLRIGLEAGSRGVVDLQGEAEAARRFHAAEVEAAGGTVSVGPLPPVYADAHQVQVLLRNLIGNAIVHRGPRPPDVYVRAGEGATDDRLCVVISDNGPGIPEAARRTVFEPFRRGADLGPIGGIGLGLAICERIVHQHGGAIGVEGNERGGADLWFTLPRADVDTAAHSPPSGHA